MELLSIQISGPLSLNSVKPTLTRIKSGLILTFGCLSLLFLTRYVLERAQTRAESDQFRFTVRDSQQVIEGNIFVIHWSTVEFEQSHMTVAEDEGQVSVMIRRKGYLNHYAIVTCSSLADDQKQQQVQFEPGEEVKPCVVPLNADDAFQVRVLPNLNHRNKHVKRVKGVKTPLKIKEHA